MCVRQTRIPHVTSLTNLLWQCSTRSRLADAVESRYATVMANTPEAHTHHAIDYIEFTVADVAEAKRFYEAAFGWRFNDYGPDYAGIQGTSRELGGLCKGEVRTGGPLVVLYSRELDATLAGVKAAGGRIVKEPFVFPGGRRFQFLDPSGNELGVWSEK